MGGEERFELAIPSILHPLLGTKLEIDGWFRANGLRASRNRKPSLEFIEKTKECGRNIFPARHR